MKNDRLRLVQGANPPPRVCDHTNFRAGLFRLQDYYNPYLGISQQYFPCLGIFGRLHKIRFSFLANLIIAAGGFTVFISRLDALIKSKGITRKQLLEDLGLGKNQITYWEKNNTIPNKVTTSAIADYFGVTPEYLRGETDECRAEQPQAFAGQEKALLSMFRRTSEEGRLRMIQAVMNICDECETRVIYRAARSETDAPPTIEARSIADLNKLKNAKKITSDEDL